MKFRIAAEGLFDYPSIAGASKMATELHDRMLRERGMNLHVSLETTDHIYGTPTEQTERSPEGWHGNAVSGSHPGDDFAPEPEHAAPASGSGRDADYQSPVGRGKGSGAEQAAALLVGTGPEGGSRGPADRPDESGSEPGSEPGQPVKRPRGRPPGPKKAGSATEGPERGTVESTSPGSAAQGTARNVDAGASKGNSDGTGRREQSDDDATGSGGEAEYDSDSDPTAPDVTWDDPEPEDSAPALTFEDVQNGMTRLFMAMGSKASRKHVFDFLEIAAGTNQPKQIPEAEYRNVVRELEDEAKAYESGRKKL